MPWLLPRRRASSHVMSLLYVGRIHNDTNQSFDNEACAARSGRKEGIHGHGHGHGHGQAKASTPIFSPYHAPRSRARGLWGLRRSTESAAPSVHRERRLALHRVSTSAVAAVGSPCGGPWRTQWKDAEPRHLYGSALVGRGSRPRTAHSGSDKIR